MNKEMHKELEEMIMDAIKGFDKKYPKTLSIADIFMAFEVLKFSAHGAMTSSFSIATTGTTEGMFQ